MADFLIRKLETFVRLSAEEKTALRALVEGKVMALAAGDDLYQEGDAPHHVNLMLSGYGCRYKMLEDGRRQIVGLFLPGDLCDARMFVLRRLDHAVGALSDMQIARINREAFIELIDSSPRLTRALWWTSLVEESIGREWMVNLGQRSAYERVGHLFCELWVRSRLVDLTQGDSCPMPFTQAQLADVAGISAVHTNRTLMALQQDGLVTVRRRRMQVHNLAQLMAVTGFNSDYLHLDHEGASLDANT